ncbi:hypothetical protein RMSM_05618 [Rhodopirellula maiorica SM1]|uniref:Uncharacterized protein n=1 Tax=Rhodopirellula maiorica SM1 TaxID=1265738 RepID=M5RPY3_9BACT|nr:hypothetical protein RMSM_05618 [Rhodopirellula maiorica SM1]
MVVGGKWGATAALSSDLYFNLHRNRRNVCGTTRFAECCWTRLSGELVAFDPAVWQTMFYTGFRHKLLIFPGKIRLCAVARLDASTCTNPHRFDHPMIVFGDRFFADTTAIVTYVSNGERSCNPAGYPCADFARA